MPASNAQQFLTSPSGAVGERNLALKVFGNSVLVAYRQATIFADMKDQLIGVKQLSGAKSHQYPILGADPAAEEHVPGDELLGQDQPFDEKVVTIDDFIVGHRFVAGDDSIISHFDAFTPYAQSIGRQLAISQDNKIVRKAIQAARTTAQSGFHNGGQVVNRVGGGTTIADAYPESTTGAANLLADMRTLARQFDEDEVPVMGRKMVLSAYARSVLLYDNTGKLFSKDFIDGENKILSRRIGHAEGFDLYVANNSIPSTNIVNSGTRSNPTKYDVDARYVAGNVAAGTGQPVAVAFAAADEGNPGLGMVIAEEFYTHMRYIPEKGGTIMIGRNFLGVDTLAVWNTGVIQGQLS